MPKTIKIDLTKRVTEFMPLERLDISDGHGGVHRHGAVVELPDDVAGAFLEAGLGHIATAEHVQKAKQEALDAADARRIANDKAKAEWRMAIHDSMPPELRQAAQENEEVTEIYLAGLMESDGQPIEGADTAETDQPRRRGRPPKQVLQ